MYPPFKIHLGYIPDTMYLNPQIYMTQKTHSRYMLDTYGIHRDTYQDTYLEPYLRPRWDTRLGDSLGPACIPHVFRMYPMLKKTVLVLTWTQRGWRLGVRFPSGLINVLYF